jgi:DedD protein
MMKGMAELQRWQDKVEISLDGRQIFFLFFGTAVAACLLFVLGVLVGKRMEARALALSPPPVEDPLAELDQIGDDDEGLTFHRALAPEKAEKPKREESARSGGDDKAVRPPTATAMAKKEVGKTPPGGSVHFTLQLPGFPDRVDADELMRKVQAAGYKASLFPSDVPGKGLVYRVRVGDFATRQAAVDAKADFERKQHLIAYVTKFQ